MHLRNAYVLSARALRLLSIGECLMLTLPAHHAYNAHEETMMRWVYMRMWYNACARVQMCLIA